MSHSVETISDLGVDALTDRFRETLNCGSANKPDFRELDLGSPVSPLRIQRGPITTTTATSSSSSSSGSVSGLNGFTKRAESGNSHSGELSGSVESSPTAAKLRGTKSDRMRPDPFIYSGSSAATSAAVNVLPTGNICPSGRISKTGMATRISKTDVLGTGTGNYGHGSIMRGGGSTRLEASAEATGKRDFSREGVDSEELNRLGNEHYRIGRFSDALAFYDRAIGFSPSNATCRFNKAVALTALRRFAEAVRECEEAIRLDHGYVKAHHRLGSLLLRLGQVENARRHLFFMGHQPDVNELHKLQAVSTHLTKCTDARKVGDWKSALGEADAAIAAGADASPQVYACKAEAFLKLCQLEDANTSLSNVPKCEESTSSSLQSKFFGMLSVAYLFFVQAQIEMAFGRFENAVAAAERAGTIDPRNIEVSVLLKRVRLVSRARLSGNELFKSGRYTEACLTYNEGLRIDPSNSILYCNRAACWYMLGQWEHSLDDCNKALNMQPNYTKAILRRAASNSKLERWSEVVRDYEALRRELPHDNEVAENLSHAQVALKKSRGEEVYNMKFDGEVELVSGLEEFRAAISSPGASVVHFKTESNLQCKQISPFLDTLRERYPSVNYLKVDVEQSHAIAFAENVRIVPTFKIYKNGNWVKEMVCPSPEVLESSVRHYSF